MKTIFLSYGVFEFDGRLRSLIDSVSSFGELYVLSLSLGQYERRKGINHKIIKVRKDFNPKSPIFFAYFFIRCVIMALRIRKVDIIFIDNAPACIPGYFIKKLMKHQHLIQDVRELNLISERKSIIGKVFTEFEYKVATSADVVICANHYRSAIMKEEYRLVQLPLVYENIRKLGDIGEIHDSIRKLLSEMDFGKIRIISTGGYSVERGTDKLVRFMAKLGSSYQLYIVGGGSELEKNELVKIIEKYNLLDNVVLIDKVNPAELKILVKNCDIGIVNYHQNDTNNKYCASGKIYEYLFEGLAIVTTENIPLVEFCENTKVGVADDSFYKGITKVSQNLDYYKNNAEELINKIDIDIYNAELYSKIRDRLNEAVTRS